MDWSVASYITMSPGIEIWVSSQQAHLTALIFDQLTGPARASYELLYRLCFSYVDLPIALVDNISDSFKHILPSGETIKNQNLVSVTQLFTFDVYTLPI